METEILSIALRDQQAVEAVRQGEADRYRELVERHERRVFAMAWSRLGNVALAEDATQEAFLLGYRRLWLLGNGAKYAAWITAIARNVAINLGLRRRRELNKLERWGLEQSPSSDANETSELCTPETLRQTLADLPAAHRECLVLFYLEDQSGAEAAATLGISEAALRVRLHRARAALRERLEEKLEGSLARLRPAKSLVPGVMAGVLASSSAKAATAGGAGATVLGALAKYGPVKWAFGYIPFILPAVLFNWLLMREELQNFRDKEGFRARLFRESARWWILWFTLTMVGIWILRPHLGDFRSWNTMFLILAGMGLFVLPFQIRRVSINRSRYFVAATVNSGVAAWGCLLVALGWMPVDWWEGLILLQAVVTVRLTEEPRQMDYNLFLRGAEGLLNAAEADLHEHHPHHAFGKKELLAFARFLGTRWLACNHRWTEDGLELGLTPVKAWLGGILRILPTRSRDSRLLLQRDGKVRAKLGRKDRKTLQRLQGDELPSDAELERLVSSAVESARGKFHAGDFGAAERALGQVPAGDVFIKPGVRTVFPRVRWGFVSACVAIIAGLILLLMFITGSFPAFSPQNISRRNDQPVVKDVQQAKNEEERFYTLGAAAKRSFAAGKIAEARDGAQRLMALLPHYQSNWNYGNAIQDANLVLGRIAVREGKIEAAKGYLLAAGESPGSPQMNSFGPNMSLAHDLLEKGERDTVLEYFQLCGGFWRGQQNKLDQWTQEVRAGKIPDFGANLRY